MITICDSEHRARGDRCVVVLTADDFSRLTKYIKRRRIGGRAVCTTVGNCCALLVKCAAQPLVSVGSRLVRFGMPGARLNGECQLISLAPNLTRCYFLDLAPWVQIEGACADDGCLVLAARHEHFQRAWRSLTLLRSLKRKMHSVGDWLDVTADARDPATAGLRGSDRCPVSRGRLGCPIRVSMR